MMIIKEKIAEDDRNFYKLFILLFSFHFLVKIFYFCLPLFSFLTYQEALFGLKVKYFKLSYVLDFNLEYIFSVLLFKIFFSHTYILRIVPFIFSLLYFLSLVSIVKRIFGFKISLFLFFFFLIPPLFFSYYSIAAGSNYMVNLCLGNVVLYLLYKIVYENDKRSLRKIDFVWLGLLNGVIIANSFKPIHAAYFFTTLLFIFLKDKKFFISLNFATFLLFFLLGNAGFIFSFFQDQNIRQFFLNPQWTKLILKTKNLFLYELSEMLGVYYSYWEDFLSSRVFQLWKIIYLYLMLFIIYNAVFKDRNILRILKADFEHSNKTEIFFFHFFISFLLFIGFPAGKNFHFYVAYSSLPVLIAYFFYDFKKESRALFYVLLCLFCSVQLFDNYQFLKVNFRREVIYRPLSKSFYFLKNKGIEVIYAHYTMKAVLDFAVDKNVQCFDIKGMIVDRRIDTAALQSKVKAVKSLAVITNDNYGFPSAGRFEADIRKVFRQYKKEKIGSYVMFYDFK